MDIWPLSDLAVLAHRFPSGLLCVVHLAALAHLVVLSQRLLQHPDSRLEQCRLLRRQCPREQPAVGTEVSALFQRLITIPHRGVGGRPPATPDLSAPLICQLQLISSFFFHAQIRRDGLSAWSNGASVDIPNPASGRLHDARLHGACRQRTPHLQYDARHLIPRYTGTRLIRGSPIS